MANFNLITHTDQHRAKQALGVVMHKLLRIIWGVLSSGTAYNPSIDQANQQKTVVVGTDNQQKELSSKRREQPFDEQAPISRIAAKKRKAFQLSQDSNADHIRDHQERPINKHTKMVEITLEN